MANEVVNRRLNIYIDQATAEQSLERLTKKENDLVAAIERQKKAGKDATKQMNDLADTRNRIGQIKDVMDGKVLPSIRMAEAAVQKLNRELKTLPANSEAAAQKLQQLRSAEQTLLRVRNAANGINTSLNDLAKNQGFLGKIQNGIGSLLGNGGLLAGGILGGAAAGSAAINFLSDAVDEALQAEEATARLRATLDNLGKSDAFERISSQADQLASSIGYLDNDDILGVFDKLLVYGKLTEQQMSKLAPIIIDFAAKQRIDLGEATDVVIKALEGNARALKTYGINMTEAGTVTEAYGVILDQLAPKVEGAAKKFGETTAGQIAKTKQEIADLKEEVGINLLPVVKEFYSVISSITDRMSFLYNKAQDMSFWEKLKFGFKTITSGGKNIYAGPLNDEFQKSQKLKELSKNAPGLNVPTIGSIDQVTLRGEGLSSAQIEALEKQEKKAEQERKRKADQAKRDKEQAQRERERAQKDLTDVLNRTEEATAPILAAYRKINEQADEDIKKIQTALAKGLISKEQAESALDGVERVLNESRDKLNKQFKLTSGLLDLVPENGNIDAETQADAKALGTNIGNTIINAVNEALKETDPVLNWLNDPETQESIEQAFIIARDLSDLFVNIGQIRTNAENAAFEKEVANNEKRKESAQKLLDQKLISQQEYNRRVSQIDKAQADRERELRRRQFERDKNAQTAQALISGAQAQLTTLAKFGAPIPPNFLAIAANALTLAVTADNVAAIRTAKPPQFAKGGFLPDGPSHAQGGIALVDRAGRKVGEVEGGEPILSRKTYARNKPLIDMLMAGSLNGSGIMTMNVPRINSSIKTVFESGGFIPRGEQASGGDLNQSISELNAILKNGIIAKLLYGEYEDVSSRISNIRSQSRIS